jgi:hypothetical protein
MSEKHIPHGEDEDESDPGRREDAIADYESLQGERLSDSEMIQVAGQP